MSEASLSYEVNGMYVQCHTYITSHWKKKKKLENVPLLGFEVGLEPGISGLAAEEFNDYANSPHYFNKVN